MSQQSPHLPAEFAKASTLKPIDSDISTVSAPEFDVLAVFLQQSQTEADRKSRLQAPDVKSSGR